MSQQPPNNDPWQQQPFSQQPNTSYPPQQPFPSPQFNQQQYPPQYQPQPPMKPSPGSPKKKPSSFLLLGIIIFGLMACSFISGAAAMYRSISTSTATASTAPFVAQSTDTVIPTATLDSSIATSTPAPTQPPAPPAKWTTVQTFKGNGIKKTAIFTVPDDWKLNWSCYGFQDNIDGAMGVTVYDSANTYIDGAVNATCKAGSTPTKDTTEEHQSGDIYLSVNATGDWTLQVQVFK